MVSVTFKCVIGLWDSDKIFRIKQNLFSEQVRFMRGFLKNHTPNALSTLMISIVFMIAINRERFSCHHGFGITKEDPQIYAAYLFNPEEYKNTYKNTYINTILHPNYD